VTSYDEVTAELRAIYADNAAVRDGAEKQPWKVEVRQAFLDLLKSEGAQRLLEVGAGTGEDSVFFVENGLDVVATDLTPEMVERCRAKGLEAHVRDFKNLGFPPESFDAAFAMNCLLHVPNADLPAALRSIADVLRRGGLLFLNVYAVDGEHEGLWEEDKLKRFFSFRSPERMRAFVEDAGFEVVGFASTELNPGFRTQSLTLRRP
jgi:SAM-dependent methyltransferase